MDFATACRLATEWRGLIGFVLSANDPFACIDLDVKDDTTAEDMERFKSIVTTFNSYSELSRSGRGMHIWVRGNIGPGCKRGGVEVYSQERFIICTGSVYIDAPVEDRQELLANMVTQMRARNIAAFNPGAHAARNDAKEAVIANSRTRHDEVALELVASHPRELITAEDLFSAVFDVDPNFTPDAGRKWALLPHIARKAGIEPLPKPFALYGRPKVKVWALRNAQGWRGALAMAVEAELNRITAPEAPLSPPA